MLRMNESEWSIAFAAGLLLASLQPALSATQIKRNDSTERLRMAVDECRKGAAPSDGGHEIQLFETKTAVCFVCLFTDRVEENVAKKLTDNSKVFVVKSWGGSGIAAASIGIDMLDKQVDIAVFDVCFSACANWIFLAGRRKYVAESTLLGWHGLPKREELSFREKTLDTSGRLAMTQHLSNVFCEKANVNKMLAASANSHNPDYPAWLARKKPDGSFGWTWTQAALEQFGVRGIVGYWYPSDPEVLRRIAVEKGIDLLVDR